jgi:hypothetical protein
LPVSTTNASSLLPLTRDRAAAQAEKDEEEDTDGVAPLGGSRMHSHRGRRDDDGDLSSDPEQRLRRVAGNLEKRRHNR